MPWYKIGCDILYLGHTMYSLVSDFYTELVELILLEGNAHSKSIIKHLKEIFGRLGIPAVLISDNEPQFASHEFESFAKHTHFF